jgi:RHS repeat-associated protein
MTMSYSPRLVVEMTDFYPGGLKMMTASRAGLNAQNYLYNGKEQINDLSIDWYDYGARMLMPEIGRWGVVDPLAENSLNWSPYDYVVDNPIGNIDPDGMDWWGAGADQMAKAADESGSTAGLYDTNAQQAANSFNWGQSQNKTKMVWNPYAGDEISYKEWLDLGNDPNVKDEEKNRYFSGAYEIQSDAVYLTQTGPPVEVYIWKKNSDVGHTAIRIGNWVYGYYPSDVNGDGRYTMEDLANSPGVMHINSISEFNKIYSGDVVTAFSLRSTSDQALGLAENLSGVALNTGFYSLTGNNCTSIAYSCLQNSGYGIVNLDISIAGMMWPTFGMGPVVLQVMLSNPINSSLGPVQSSRTFTVGR